jgi:glucose/arabinose dehydrogenase
MSLRRQGASYLAVFLAAACGGGDDAAAPAQQQLSPPTLGVARVFPALSFTQPIAMLQAPGDGTRWFVVEQGGTVREFANQPQVSTSAVFADITDRVRAGGEMGLLGMAFHPGFPTNPRIYVNYTHQDPLAGLVTRISEFRVTANGFDRDTERILLTINQPETNHNGGHLAFGSDGFLYIGMGDGGGGNDDHPPFGNAQLMTTLLGKMLRIDVSPAWAYAIPSDNPFVANASAPCHLNGAGSLPCPEIYASGFRNPWRWSFDRVTNILWLGDVGQGALEEIDRVTRGGNYGWRCFEGTQPTGLGCPVPPPAFIAPVAEYARGGGAAVTGGHVYRGSAIPGLVGRYVFGDFIQQQLWHIAADTQPTQRMAAGVQTGLNISSFGEDIAGELYVVDYGGGLYRLTGN